MQAWIDNRVVSGREGTPTYAERGSAAATTPSFEVSRRVGGSGTENESLPIPMSDKRASYIHARLIGLRRGGGCLRVKTSAHGTGFLFGVGERSFARIWEAG